MKIIKFEDLRTIENPAPGTPYRPEIKLDGARFKNIGGMFGLLVPGSQVPYHYHKDRESILIPISGEAVEIVEGKETVVHPGDVLLIPAGEKHAIANRSNEDFRFLEFFTCPPLSADFVKVEQGA
jgi:oxalate decarboxylase/phosphoglucose isomerase-like protein (cupin superfamily)